MRFPLRSGRLAPGRRRPPTLLWVGLSLWVLSAPGPARAATFSTHVYVGARDQICQYRLHLPTGAITPLTPPCVPMGHHPLTLTLSPSQRSLYVVTSEATLVRFAVHPVSGRLTQRETVQANLLTGAMAMCPAGRRLFVLSSAVSRDLPPGRSDNSIWVFALHPGTEALQFVGIVDAGVKGASGVTVDPACMSLYVTGKHSDAVAQFRIDPQGLPTPLEPRRVSTGAGSGPLALTLDRDGACLYVANGHFMRAFGHWSVAQFHRDSQTGQLTPLPSFLEPVGPLPTSLHLDTSNQVLRVTTDFHDHIWSYQKDTPTCTLRPLQPPTVETVHHPWSITDNDESTVALVASRSDEVWKYRIAAETGQLDKLEPRLIPARGWRPTNVAISRPRALVAQQDMRQLAKRDPHFRRHWAGTFGFLPEGEQHAWDFTFMVFTVVVGPQRREVSIVHALNRADPQLRCLQYREPVSGQLTDWLCQH